MVSVKGWTDKEIVDELCSIDEGLNTWELDFVDSMALRYEAERTLTTGMRDKAEQIFRKVDDG